MTIQPAFEYADCAFLFIQHCCIFEFFFHFGRIAPLVLFEICGRIGNEMPRKRKMLVTKRWVQLEKKRWERTSLGVGWLLLWFVVVVLEASQRNSNVFVHTTLRTYWQREPSMTNSCWPSRASKKSPEIRDSTSQWTESFFF